ATDLELDRPPPDTAGRRRPPDAPVRRPGRLPGDRGCALPGRRVPTSPPRRGGGAGRVPGRARTEDGARPGDRPGLGRDHPRGRDREGPSRRPAGPAPRRRLRAARMALRLRPEGDAPGSPDGAAASRGGCGGSARQEEMEMSIGISSAHTVEVGYDEFCGALAARDLQPLWKMARRLMPVAPLPTTRPWIWRWADTLPLARRAGELITVDRGGDRRVLAFANPGLNGLPFTSTT